MNNEMVGNDRAEQDMNHQHRMVDGSTDGYCPKCGADICAQLAEAYDAGRESVEVAAPVEAHAQGAQAGQGDAMTRAELAKAWALWKEHRDGCMNMLAGDPCECEDEDTWDAFEGALEDYLAAPVEAHGGAQPRGEPLTREESYGCGRYGPVIGLRCNQHRDGKHRAMTYETLKTDRAAEEWPLDADAPVEAHGKRRVVCGVCYRPKDEGHRCPPMVLDDEPVRKPPGEACALIA